MLSNEQQEFVKKVHEAHQEYLKLPHEEKVARLLASGLVDENGQLIDRGPGDLRSGNGKNGNGKSHQ